MEFRGLLFLGILVLLPGCGLLTMPVSLPYALMQNKHFGTQMEIVDDQGNPLDDVIVTLTAERYSWSGDPDLGPHFPDDERKTFLVDRVFDSGTQWGWDLRMDFEKRGYRRRTVDANTERAIYSSTGPMSQAVFPAAPRMRVVLPRKNRDLPRLVSIQYQRRSDDQSPVALDLSNPQASDEDLLDNRYARALSTLGSAPAHIFIATFEMPNMNFPAGTEVERRDLLPIGLKLQLPGEGNGFIRFTPVAGDDPLNQMAEAPGEGYQPELAFDQQRMRQFPKVVHWRALRQMTSEGCEFFYFRVNGRFGKGYITTTGDESRVEYRYYLLLNPDRSPNLTTDF